MDPTQYQMPIFPLVPGFFDSNQDSEDFLSSLDSDTRDYVLKHTDEFSNRDDLYECVNRLHRKS